ncbi:hypothetical protein PCH_Pc20g06100 [Penicillium rubens Wisconsin 54-1255]|uniref:Uncharacterized protein n=1 Tax=Penicillium rubens (strain ATCC 28089 / DSM 1075 / NRRL 1951 / Wisconsin 54-1255) TaxID=500485 RepID=B6HFT1_PENRW|nr:hypothetical protein PCH_Pc20g06100 [Penicillium rubens Wisconsin 54-1255]
MTHIEHDYQVWHINPRPALMPRNLLRIPAYITETEPLWLGRSGIGLPYAPAGRLDYIRRCTEYAPMSQIFTAAYTCIYATSTGLLRLPRHDHYFPDYLAISIARMAFLGWAGERLLTPSCSARPPDDMSEGTA